MANKVTGQVLGGDPQTFDGVSSVREVAEKLGIGDGYVASINAEPADMDSALSGFEYVSFTKAVKSGC